MCGGKFDKVVDEQVAEEKKRQIFSWNPKITKHIEDSNVDPEGGQLPWALSWALHQC